MLNGVKRTKTWLLLTYLSVSFKQQLQKKYFLVHLKQMEHLNKPYCSQPHKLRPWF